MEVLLEQISIPEERQRKDLGNLEYLKTSLENLGLLNPLIVESKPEGGFSLIAGERRFTAIRELREEGKWHSSVSVTLKEDLDDKARYLLELDENIKRKDLEWQEYCKAVDKMFSIVQPCTQEAFAQEIGISRTVVGRILSVASMLDDPLVQQAKNLSNAWTIVSRINARKMDSVILDINDILEEEDFLDEKVEEDENVRTGEPGVSSVAGERHGSQPSLGNGLDGSASSGSKPVAKSVEITRELEQEPKQTPVLPQYQIRQGDFLEFATIYEGVPFNLIHCDFPYGIEHDRSQQGSTDTYGTYEDTEDLYKTLVRTLLNNKDRLIAPSAHVIMWLSLRFEEWTKQEFAKHGFTWNMQPFIWFKNDNRGIIADKDCGMRNVGEYALVFNRGRRKVCKNISNIFAHPTTKKFHASEKPGAMLDYLFSGFADETSRVLDPTCGSGTAIQAAMRAGCAEALGLELDESFAEKALDWLDLEKRKQGVEKKFSLTDLEIEI